jgi:FkbM family methyltransferase
MPLKNNIVNLFYKIINYIGFDLIRIPFKTKRMNYDEIFKLKIKNKKPIIFDVGANEGQSIKRFKNIFPNSIIHSFEPNKNCYELLLKKYSNDKNIILNNLSCGEKIKKKKFLIMAKSGNSSFININKNSAWMKKRSEEIVIKKYIVKKPIVKMITLDSYIRKNKIKKIDILKLDTQGYEDKIIKGCQNSLKKIHFIEAEIMLDNVYKKFLNISDIEKKIIKKKFRLVGIEHHGGFKNLFEGYMFVVDTLYMRTR